MSPPRIGSVVERRDRVASTMDAIRDLDVDGAVLVAREQTEGRGRHDRTWHSPEGGLYLSVLLKPDVAPAKLGLIPLAAGLAVAEALDRWNLRAKLSWPNDVLVGRSKIAGVLSESRLSGDRVDDVVVGVGLNVNATLFPPELDATSIRLETGRAVDLDAVLEAVLGALDRRFEGYAEDPAGFLEDYEVRCTTLDAEVAIETDGAKVHGRAVGIGDDGELVLRTADELVRVRAGDVREVVEEGPR